MTEPAMFVFDPLQVNGGRVRRAEGDDGVKMDTYVKSGEWHKAQAEVARLRDERDALRELYTDENNARAEWQRVAGVLADALRETMGNMDSGYRDTPTIYRQARSALAVFDTLTED